jgi:hypothetical protein
MKAHFALTIKCILVTVSTGELFAMTPKSFDIVKFAAIFQINVTPCIPDPDEHYGCSTSSHSAKLRSLAVLKIGAGRSNL